MNLRPTTILINSRCDMRSIAVLHQFWSKELGNLNMSQVLRFSIDQFAEVLVKNDLATECKSTSEAKAYLESVKFSFPSGLHRNLAKQIQKETLLSDGFSPDYATNPKTLVEQARAHMRKGKQNTKRAESPETEAEAIKRRQKEMQQIKEQMKGLPNE